MGDFTHEKLNRDGEIAVSTVERAFIELKQVLGTVMASPREAALARTKLQEASYWAKKAVCEDPSNQY